MYCHHTYLVACKLVSIFSLFLPFFKKKKKFTRVKLQRVLYSASVIFMELICIDPYKVLLISFLFAQTIALISIFVAQLEIILWGLKIIGEQLRWPQPFAKIYFIYYYKCCLASSIQRTRMEVKGEKSWNFLGLRRHKWKRGHGYI